jgi:hypothetical protein
MGMKMKKAMKYVETKNLEVMKWKVLGRLCEDHEG